MPTHPQKPGLSSYELNLRLLEVAEFTSVTLVRIADSLERIAGHAEQMATDDPLSRVERALERAPEVLGFDPVSNLQKTQIAPDRSTFDHRFAGRPIEEQVR